MTDQGIDDSPVQNKMPARVVKTPVNRRKIQRVLDGRTCLYRHYDSDGVLLYVGIALSPIMRTKSHRHSSQWFSQIAIVLFEWHESRARAEVAEALAINLEKPLYNSVIPYTPDYDIYDPDEKRVETARVIQRIRARGEIIRTTRRKRLKAEIESAGLVSAL